MNIGGATDRPILAKVWKTVQKKLKGEGGAQERPTTTGVFHLLREKVRGY